MTVTENRREKARGLVNHLPRVFFYYFVLFFFLFFFYLALEGHHHDGCWREVKTVPRFKQCLTPPWRSQYAPNFIISPPASPRKRFTFRFETARKKARNKKKILQSGKYSNKDINTIKSTLLVAGLPRQRTLGFITARLPWGRKFLSC